MATHVSRMMNANIFLNRPCGFASHLTRLITHNHHTDRIKSILPTHKAYNTILITHCNNDAGKMTARISEYVGEQVLKIGHNAAHSKIFHNIHHCSFALIAKSLLR
jgi:biotin synthase-related radical SAM superfamily protein